MKVVLLAGGLGTRISEETHTVPKPMVKIGDKPIIWHIMKHFATHGYTEFVICLGYKGYAIKEFFINYFRHHCDLTVDLATNSIDIHQNQAEPWKITLVETGLKTMTGGRIKRVGEYLDGPFLMTYGDGVSDVDVTALVAAHRQAGRLATMTAVQPQGRFGSLKITDGSVDSFQEKPKGDGGWINGGFFALEPEVLDYIDGDDTIWEREPLETIAAKGQLTAYKHDGFWQCMDTLYDKNKLNAMWDADDAKWKTWA